MIQSRDEIPINSFHHVEFWVGNAKQADYFYRNAFGFHRVAYAGPETGVRDRASYVLQQGSIRFVFTTPIPPQGEMVDHIRVHGDGVRDIAFGVPNCESAYRLALSRGATSAYEPIRTSDEHGTVVRAGIRTYGDTIHSLVETSDGTGVFLPGFEKNHVSGSSHVGLLKIDHVVGNVETGKMDEWVKFYEEIFGFQHFLSFDDKDISTDYTALMSKVMTNGKGVIKLPLNEPAAGRKRSQIEEYLDFYRGPGVQHIAMLTGDILESVACLRENGVEFLRIPDTYYEELPKRVGSIDESSTDVSRLGILVDRDEDGYLLQLFTQPVEDRPTLFFEIIQRKGSQSFGKGNFKALFESIEREQEKRGNL